MKSHTDLEQSKVLAEILPLESADFFWIIGHLHTDGPRYEIVRPRNEVSEIEKYWPCWSLAALLDILKNPMLLKYDGSWHIYNEDIKCLDFDNSIDACYEMVIKLHEEGLL